ncbi:MAG: hypothetical protein J6Y28_02605 [Acholeplasmatales bacterium]|nr:hypothetical protein [Acholeplasmatales bacterium]
MAKMTINDLKTFVANYVAAASQASAWSATTNNLFGLLDKIGLQITLDGLFVDKLPEFDGEDLPLGKTIEEWFVDLILPQDYDSTGANTLAPHYPSVEDASYNYSLGRKVIATTVPYDNVERAALTPEDAANFVAKIIQRLQNSYALYTYAQKKQLVANAIAKAQALDSAYTTGATAYTTNSTVLSKGTRYSQSSVAYLCIKSADAAINKTLATLAAEGEYVVKINQVKTITAITDTTSAEAFITQVKKDVEEASFANQGNAFSGALIGAAPEMVLLVKKGTMPVIEVEAEAGAFNLDKVAIPARIKVVDDFGNADSSVTAVLMDPRGVKLHRGYHAIREQLNGEGDFMNYFDHSENTGFISKYTYFRVYKAS